MKRVVDLSVTEALQEFLSTVEAVGEKQVSCEWPDLYVTYRRAFYALNGRWPS
jgi:hypothetical protein